VNSSNSSKNAGAYAQIVYGALIMVFIIAAPKGLNGFIHLTGRKAAALVRWGGRGRGTAVVAVAAASAGSSTPNASINHD
jgi:hypothetical protein